MDMTPAEAAAFLRRFRFGKVASETADEVKPGVVAAMKLFAPKGRRDGKRGKTLEDSITGVRHTTTGGGELVVSTDVDYARFVLRGTKPHKIQGRPLLAFTWASGTPRWLAATGGTNVLVIVRSVQHPGTRANPFNKRAWDSVQSGVVRRFRANVAKEFTA